MTIEKRKEQSSMLRAKAKQRLVVVSDECSPGPRRVLASCRDSANERDLYEYELQIRVTRTY